MEDAPLPKLKRGQPPAGRKAKPRQRVLIRGPTVAQGDDMVLHFASAEYPLEVKAQHGRQWNVTDYSQTPRRVPADWRRRRGLDALSPFRGLHHVL